MVALSVTSACSTSTMECVSSTPVPQELMIDLQPLREATGPGDVIEACIDNMTRAAECYIHYEGLKEAVEGREDG
jgi:hypothetical protein